MTSAVLKCCPVDVTVNRSLSTGKLHRVELLLQTKLAPGTLDVLLSKSFLCAPAVGVSNMIAKLAKTCTLRISPDKLNFILSDKLASGGVSMWCELEQVSRSSPGACGLLPNALGRTLMSLLFLPLGELFQRISNGRYLRS